jgi:acetyl-CoA acetyltransferase
MTARDRWPRPVISGLGRSQIGRRIGRSAMNLTIDAITAAIADAGLRPADIDGLATYPGLTKSLNPGFLGPDLYDVQDAVGLRLDWHHCAPQGPAQIAPVMAAAAAVASGLCRHALVFRTTTESSAQGVGQRGGTGDEMGRAESVWTWLLSSGAISVANWVALYARRHMHEYGTKKEQLGWIAVTQRDNSMRNPDAVFKTPLTMADYLDARVISSPLTLFDCDVPVDGCVAVILSSPDCRSDLRHPITIESLGSAMRHRPSWEQWPDLTTMATHDAAEHMWKGTDLRPADVDVALMYDGFSVLAMFWLEAMGFCGRGEGGAFVEGGERISLSGALPLNPHGGQLSAGRMHGYGVLAEAVVQLRGEAGERQVAGAEVAAVGVGGGAAAGSMLLTVIR